MTINQTFQMSQIFAESHHIGDFKVTVALFKLQ